MLKLKKTRDRHEAATLSGLHAEWDRLTRGSGRHFG